MKAIVINESDNVAIVIKDISKGEEINIDGNTCTAVDDIPYTHKVAMTDLKQGAAIVKHGEVIATNDKP